MNFSGTPSDSPGAHPWNAKEEMILPYLDPLLFLRERERKIREGVLEVEGCPSQPDPLSRWGEGNYGNGRHRE
jgi:hypothetical protein